MPTRELIIFGAGGHGLVVADSAVKAGWRVIGFVDDDADAASPGVAPMLTLAALAAHPDAALIIAIGDNELRRAVLRRLSEADGDTGAGLTLANVIDPSAQVSEHAALSQGVFVGPNAVVNAGAQLGLASIVNSGAIVEHHVEVGDYSHIAPGAALGGRAKVGRRSLIGLNATVLPGVSIGNECAVGAGAVVTRDVDYGDTVTGCPARPVRKPSHPHDQHDHMTGDGTILA